jgi:hypothetical protein
VNVFDLDRSLLSDYERFARSFTQIRAADTRSRFEEIHARGRFWPEALININPHFERRASVEELVAEGAPSRHCACVPRRWPADQASTAG